MNHARIEEWSVVGYNDPYKAPEQKRTLYLVGNVYGHANHTNGKKVITSPIMHADGRTVFTLNTKYVLGKVNIDYKEWYSKVLGRLLNENDPFSGQ